MWMIRGTRSVAKGGEREWYGVEMEEEKLAHVTVSSVLMDIMVMSSMMVM